MIGDDLCFGSPQIRCVGPLSKVGVVRRMGRSLGQSLGIAGELSSCALFVFSSGLAAFGCSTFAYIYTYSSSVAFAKQLTTVG